MSIDNRGKPFTSRFSVFALNPQVIPSGVATVVSMGTGVDFNPLNEVDIAVYTFTPIQAGYYYFHACTGIQTLGINDAAEIWIRHNLLNIAYDYKVTPIAANVLVEAAAVAYVLPVDTIVVDVSHNLAQIVICLMVAFLVVSMGSE